MPDWVWERRLWNARFFWFGIGIWVGIGLHYLFTEVG